MSTIDWELSADEDDNDVWEGHGPYVQDFRWRLRQMLRNNVIVWYQADDPELGGADKAFWCPTLEQAKDECQEAHDNILEEQA